MLINPYISYPSGGGGGGAFVGALDAYSTNLWFAGGIKRLLSTYVGALLRIRRSSDNTELDIGYNAGDGSLDTVSMLAWVGASSAFIAKVYDQSGAGNYFQQTTATQQPRIVNAGVYDGFIRFDGTDDVLSSVNPTPVLSAITIATRYALRAASGAGASQSIMTHGNAGAVGHNVLLYQEQQNNGKVNAYEFEASSSLSNGYTATTTAEVADLVAFNKAASGAAKIAAFRNGSAQTQTSTTGSQTTANFTSETMYIGSYTGLQAAQMNGKAFAVWSNSQATSGAAITAAI